MLTLRSRRGDARKREHKIVVGSLVSPRFVHVQFSVGFMVANQRTRDMRNLVLVFGMCR